MLAAPRNFRTLWIVRSPVEICFGPARARRRSRGLWANTSPVPIAATIALEMIGPMPGTVFLPALAVIEQQDCSMLDWTSAANGALLLRPEAP